MKRHHGTRVKALQEALQLEGPFRQQVQEPLARLQALEERGSGRVTSPRAQQERTHSKQREEEVTLQRPQETEAFQESGQETHQPRAQEEQEQEQREE